jgi:hypothetical protein
MLALGSTYRAPAVLALALIGAACSSESVVGEQCPSPLTGRATVESLPDGGEPAGASIYGTSCAPCEAEPPRLDADGCPIYVTFQSCGGDICIGTRRIAFMPPYDDDAGVDDAGTDDGSDPDAGGGDGVGDQDAGGGDE